MNAVEAELGLAHEMLKDAELMIREERPRSSANRAYYSIFHATRAILLYLGTDCQSHAGAINRFGEYVIKKGLLSEEFAKTFHQAYRLREKSDYQPIAKISKEEAENLYKQAKEFVREIENLICHLKDKDVVEI